MKKVDSGADGGQVVRDGGQGWRRERRRRGAAGLEAAMVLNKSKIMSAPLLLVLFNVRPNLFCTAWEFAPADGLAGMPEAVMLEGSQAGGLSGLYPPLHLYSRDDKSV